MVVDQKCPLMILLAEVQTSYHLAVDLKRSDVIGFADMQTSYHLAGRLWVSRQTVGLYWFRRQTVACLSALWLFCQLSLSVQVSIALVVVRETSDEPEGHPFLPRHPFLRHLN